MYTEKVMDHFQHPRNVGELENASGVGTVGNAKCGDIMRIYLDIDENQIIRDVKFKTFGCGPSVYLPALQYPPQCFVCRRIRQAGFPAPAADPPSIVFLFCISSYL